MKKGILAVGLAVAALAGCGGGGTPVAGGSSVPTCSSLVGKTLTSAVETKSCTDAGALQMTADVKCKDGTMVAFGNVAGGYIGQPIRAGNFANWPGCAPA